VVAGAGVVVGGHINRLYGRDRATLGGCDALLQVAHFARKIRLIADGRWHTAEQRRNFRAGLGEAENVVDEKQHVLAFIAEIFGDSESGESDTQARAGRLGHLPIDEHDFRLVPIVGIDNPGFLHFPPEIVAFARALADSYEHRYTAMLHGDVVDQFLDDDRFTDARAAEQADFAAAQIGLEQVDNFDAGLEHFQTRRLLFERGPGSMNWRRLLGFDRTHVVDRLPKHVEHAAERLLADWNRNRGAGIDSLHTEHNSVSRLHRDGAHAAFAGVLRDLGDDIDLDRNIEALLVI
jgi:hypothetical protein